MKIDFDKLVKGVLIFSFLLVAFSVFYYFVIFQQARLEQQKQIEETKIEQRMWEEGTPAERQRIEMKRRMREALEK